EVRPEYERNSPRMSSNSYVNLKIATCLVRYADDRLIDQRFPKASLNKALRRNRQILHENDDYPWPDTPDARRRTPNIR
ncbi:hypothetical protein, partial [Burkholderia contaminans]|uniref:hypothetical protein n=1 Tax=Burkholderia contaminans TaxID=488447 RepID=UPI002D80FBA6